MDPGTARDQSVDPTTASHGGRLGCGSTGDFPALADTFTALPLQRFSAPVQVGSLFYVIAVTSKQAQPESAVQPQIVSDLLTETQPFNTYLERALTTAKVTVAARYGHYDRSLSPPAVAPPPA